MSTVRHFAFVNETYIRREEAASSMEEGMTPSSRFTAGTAFTAVFALIISSMSAVAAGGGGAIVGATPSGFARHAIALGAPAHAPTLGAARTRHDRRFYARRYYGPDVPFVYGSTAPASATPDGPQAFNLDALPPARGDCAHPRIIEVGPATTAPGPLPKVIYGSRPPCDPRHFSRGALTVPD